LAASAARFYPRQSDAGRLTEISRRKSLLSVRLHGKTSRLKDSFCGALSKFLDFSFERRAQKFLSFKRNHCPSL
jgi:hypothetical protein